MTDPTARLGVRDWFRPTVWVAIVVVLADIAWTTALSLSTGLQYADIAKSAGNVIRMAVVPLGVGAILLTAFLMFARWDHVWRDPRRLPTTPAMKVAMVVFVTAIVLRFAGTGWSEIRTDLLLAVLALGVLVGYVEEILFRGIFLRAMRQGGRSEARAAVWTAVVFGLFHLPNVFLGQGWLGLLQVVVATLTGATLYAFRRQWAFILPAMIAHGVWDISTFLSGGKTAAWLTVLSLPMLLVPAAAGVAVLVSVWRRDQAVVAIPVNTPPKAAVDADPMEVA
ncbi:MAG: CPBP family intramembrane glutamic endopeptidase [Propionicimonas sp.]